MAGDLLDRYHRRLQCGLVSVFHEKPSGPLVVHVHAVVFSIWLLIMTAQVISVLGDRVKWHRRFGWFAAAWSGLMMVLGPWAVMSSLSVNLHTGDSTPWFLAVNVINLGGFLFFTGWGLTLRKNPAAHKRIMMLVLVVFADPGFSRLTDYLVSGPRTTFSWFLWTFYGNFALLIGMTLWDWWRGRLMRQWVLGSTGVVVAYLAAWFLYFWPPWRELTTHWVEAWARTFV